MHRYMLKLFQDLSSRFIWYNLTFVTFEHKTKAKVIYVREQGVFRAWIFHSLITSHVFSSFRLFMSMWSSFYRAEFAGATNPTNQGTVYSETWQSRSKQIDEKHCPSWKAPQKMQNVVWKENPAARSRWLGNHTSRCVSTLTLSLFIALTCFYSYLTYSLLLLTSSASDFVCILTFSRLH